MSGLIHIYTGDGKGKTTAGVGLSVRCAGSGHKVLYAQFLKNDKSGELKILEEIPGIHVMHCEKCFGFSYKMTDEVTEQAKEFYAEHFRRVIKTAVDNGYKLLVLDELIATYNLNLVDKQEVQEFLQNKPEDMEVVMTGREPAEELIELADYVSEVKKVKHPFDKGIEAREGIEM